MKILRIDTSVRSSRSHSRELTDRVVASFGPEAEVTVRDLAAGMPLVDEVWIGAIHTPPEARTPEQDAALALSEEMIAEVFAADVLVIGVPVYNLGIPACLKAWIDQVVRAGRTFEFIEYGAQGLVTGKRAILVYVSSGTPLGASFDFASSYMRLILGFIGITDVEVVSCPMMLADPTALERARVEADRVGGMREAVAAA